MIDFLFVFYVLSTITQLVLLALLCAVSLHVIGPPQPSSLVTLSILFRSSVNPPVLESIHRISAFPHLSCLHYAPIEFSMSAILNIFPRNFNCLFLMMSISFLSIAIFIKIPCLLIRSVYGISTDDPLKHISANSSFYSHSWRNCPTFSALCKDSNLCFVSNDIFRFSAHW